MLELGGPDLHNSFHSEISACWAYRYQHLAGLFSDSKSRFKMETACSSQPSITGYGDSASTLSKHASAIRCYEKYRVTCNLPELSSISRGAFCCDEFFQKFAYYLTDVYKTKFEDPLTKGSALGYIGCILIHGETKLFKGI